MQLIIVVCFLWIFVCITIFAPVETRIITDFIERKLGLIVNAEKSKIGRPTSIKFLGFGYFKGKERWETKPHAKSILKLRRKLKALTKRSWSISLDSRLLKIKQLVVGWVNYFRIAKMKTILAELDQKLRKRIRVVIWKQWKKTRTRYDALRKLGANHANAFNTANCRKGYQYVCGTATIHSAISNARLQKRGLTFLLDRFQKSIHLLLEPPYTENRTYGGVRGANPFAN